MVWTPHVALATAPPVATFPSLMLFSHSCPSHPRVLPFSSPVPLLCATSVLCFQIEQIKIQSSQLNLNFK